MKALEIKFQGGDQSPWSTPWIRPCPSNNKSVFLLSLEGLLYHFSITSALFNTDLLANF